MKIIGFVWLEKIIEKLEQKHNVRQYEVRGVIENNPKFRYVEKGLQPDENVYAGEDYLREISDHILYLQNR